MRISDWSSDVCSSDLKRPDPLRESRSMPIATQSGGCSRFCTVLPPNRRVPKLHATRVNDRGSQPKKSGNQIVNNMMLEPVRSQSLAAEQPTMLQNLFQLGSAAWMRRVRQ